MAELSGFEVLALVKEISSRLRGSYLNNVYSFGASQLFRFRSPQSEDSWLVISPKLGAWISTSVSERGQTTEFTTKLRGHLERARFLGASQVDLDRVYEIELDGGERKRLVVEMMPPGNIVIVDSDGRILLAMHEVRSGRRRVVRGEEYKPPTQTRLSPAMVEAKDVEEMLRSEPTVGRAIGRHVALPRKYVAEVLTRLGAADGDPSSGLQSNPEEVANVLRGLVREAREEPKPCICSTPTGDDIFVVPASGLQVKMMGATVSELCDSLLLEEAGELETEPSAEEKKKRELEATIASLRSRTVSLGNEAVRFRTAASKAAASPITEALQLLKESGAKSAREPRTSASVASILFDRAKALESESKEATEAAAKLERKIPKIAPARKKETSPIPKHRDEWYEKFRWFFTSEGKLAIGGRDAQTNATLLARHVDEKDTVYHADLFGSPFFVLKGGSAQSQDEVIEVAAATIAFSSAWKTALGSADAFWVEPGQVSASAPSGEYLPKGSYSIRGKKNFVNKNIVEVAVGLSSLGGVMAGPEKAIRAHCEVYVVLAPHREKPSDTAKGVLRELAAGAHATPGPTLDEILRAIPSGGGKIIRRHVTG